MLVVRSVGYAEILGPNGLHARLGLSARRGAVIDRNVGFRSVPTDVAKRTYAECVAGGAPALAGERPGRLPAICLRCADWRTISGRR